MQCSRKKLMGQIEDGIFYVPCIVILIGSSTEI
jgi:hypothetical protein